MNNFNPNRHQVPVPWQNLYGPNIAHQQMWYHQVIPGQQFFQPYDSVIYSPYLDAFGPGALPLEHYQHPHQFLGEPRPGTPHPGLQHILPRQQLDNANNEVLDLSIGSNHGNQTPPEMYQLKTSPVDVKPQFPLIQSGVPIRPRPPFPFSVKDIALPPHRPRLPSIGPWFPTLPNKNAVRGVRLPACMDKMQDTDLQKKYRRMLKREEKKIKQYNRGPTPVTASHPVTAPDLPVINDRGIGFPPMFVGHNMKNAEVQNLANNPISTPDLTLLNDSMKFPPLKFPPFGGSETSAAIKKKRQYRKRKDVPLSMVPSKRPAFGDAVPVKAEKWIPPVAEYLSTKSGHKAKTKALQSSNIVGVDVNQNKVARDSLTSRAIVNSFCNENICVDSPRDYVDSSPVSPPLGNPLVIDFDRKPSTEVDADTIDSMFDDFKRKYFDTDNEHETTNECTSSDSQIVSVKGTGATDSDVNSRQRFFDSPTATSSPLPDVTCPTKAMSEANSSTTDSEPKDSLRYTHLKKRRCLEYKLDATLNEILKDETKSSCPVTGNHDQEVEQKCNSVNNLKDLIHRPRDYDEWKIYVVQKDRISKLVGEAYDDAEENEKCWSLLEEITGMTNKFDSENNAYDETENGAQCDKIEDCIEMKDNKIQNEENVDARVIDSKQMLNAKNDAANIDVSKSDDVKYCLSGDYLIDDSASEDSPQEKGLPHLNLLLPKEADVKKPTLKVTNVEENTKTRQSLSCSFTEVSVIEDSVNEDSSFENKPIQVEGLPHMGVLLPKEPHVTKSSLNPKNIEENTVASQRLSCSFTEDSVNEDSSFDNKPTQLEGLPHMDVLLPKEEHIAKPTLNVKNVVDNTDASQSLSCNYTEESVYEESSPDHYPSQIEELTQMDVLLTKVIKDTLFVKNPVEPDVIRDNTVSCSFSECSVIEDSVVEDSINEDNATDDIPLQVKGLPDMDVLLTKEARGKPLPHIESIYGKEEKINDVMIIKKNDEDPSDSPKQIKVKDATCGSSVLSADMIKCPCLEEPISLDSDCNENSSVKSDKELIMSSLGSCESKVLSDFSLEEHLSQTLPYPLERENGSDLHPLEDSVNKGGNINSDNVKSETLSLEESNDDDPRLGCEEQVLRNNDELNIIDDKTVSYSLSIIESDCDSDITVEYGQTDDEETVKSDDFPSSSRCDVKGKVVSNYSEPFPVADEIKHSHQVVANSISQSYEFDSTRDDEKHQSPQNGVSERSDGTMKHMLGMETEAESIEVKTKLDNCKTQQALSEATTRHEEGVTESREVKMKLKEETQSLENDVNVTAKHEDEPHQSPENDVCVSREVTTKHENEGKNNQALPLPVHVAAETSEIKTDETKTSIQIPADGVGETEVTTKTDDYALSKHALQISKAGINKNREVSGKDDDEKEAKQALAEATLRHVEEGENIKKALQILGDVVTANGETPTKQDDEEETDQGIQIPQDDVTMLKRKLNYLSEDKDFAKQAIKIPDVCVSETRKNTAKQQVEGETKQALPVPEVDLGETTEATIKQEDKWETKHAFQSPNTKNGVITTEEEEETKQSLQIPGADIAETRQISLKYEDKGNTKLYLQIPEDNVAETRDVTRKHGEERDTELATQNISMEATCLEKCDNQPLDEVRKVKDHVVESVPQYEEFCGSMLRSSSLKLYSNIEVGTNNFEKSATKPDDNDVVMSATKTDGIRYLCNRRIDLTSVVKCSICHCEVVEAGFLIHLRAQHGRFECIDALYSETFEEITALKDHINLIDIHCNIKGLKHRCPICDDNIKMCNLDLTWHLKEIHGNKDKHFVCPQCLLQTSDLGDFVEHLTMLHGDGVTPSTCPLCGVDICLNNCTMIPHMWSQHRHGKDTFPCIMRECKATFNNMVLFLKHVKDDHASVFDHIIMAGRIVKLVWKKTKPSRSETARVSLATVKITEIVPEPSPVEVEGHGVHPADHLKMSRITEKKSKPAKCSSLNERFKLLKSNEECQDEVSPGNVFQERSIMIHQHKSRYSCDVQGCQTSSDSICVIKTHMLECHGQIISFECPLEYCKKQFVDKKSLWKHYKLCLQKTTMQSFWCPFCPNGSWEFCDSRSLNNHVTQSHNLPSVEEDSSSNEEHEFVFVRVESSNIPVKGSIVHLEMEEKPNDFQNQPNVHSNQSEFSDSNNNCNQSLPVKDMPLPYPDVVQCSRPNINMKAQGNFASLDNQGYPKGSESNATTVHNNKWQPFVKLDDISDLTHAQVKSQSHKPHERENEFECTWSSCDKRFESLSQMKRHRYVHQWRQENGGKPEKVKRTASTPVTSRLTSSAEKPAAKIKKRRRKTCPEVDERQRAIQHKHLDDIFSDLGFGPTKSHACGKKDAKPVERRSSHEYHPGSFERWPESEKSYSRPEMSASSVMMSEGRRNELQGEKLQSKLQTNGMSDTDKLKLFLSKSYRKSETGDWEWSVNNE